MELWWCGGGSVCDGMKKRGEGFAGDGMAVDSHGYFHGEEERVEGA